MEEIQQAIDHYYGSASKLEDILANIVVEEEEKVGIRSIRSVTRKTGEESEEASVSELFDYLVNQSILHHATDIHVEPTITSTMIRIRVDGVLHLLKEIPKTHHKSLVSVIKVESGLDITESRLPQDGQIELEWNIGIEM